MIRGTPCYNASLAVFITSSKGTRLYKYEAEFKPHVAAHWQDPSLDRNAKELADRFVDPTSFSLGSSLPEWMPESDYYEANAQVIRVGRDEYEKIRIRDWITYTHPLHYEGWRIVAFDPENERAIVVAEGIL